MEGRWVAAQFGHGETDTTGRDDEILQNSVDLLLGLRG
jgi:hypothetical protein